MKAEITFSQLFWNKSLMNFFFREQAQQTLEDLIERSTEFARDVVDRIDDVTEDWDINDLEELFYSEGTADVAEELGITLKED
jgi:GH35 family endo-1,4-beta-xylanase